MRNFRDYALSKNKKVIYVELHENSEFLKSLKQILVDQNITELNWMETSDTAPQQNLIDVCSSLHIAYHISPNKLFITSSSSFTDWYRTQKKPLMESFYRWQRKRTGILMNGVLPEGDKWNYDSDNQKPLPKSGVTLPPLDSPAYDKNTQDVIKLIDKIFPHNPGNAHNFWLPTNFESSDNWLHHFVSTRLVNFGTYEDASKAGEAFLFHSVLSPLLNTGLLTPDVVITSALTVYKNGEVPLNSIEGFVRQIIGWREYMHGMYHATPNLIDANYFGFTKQLETWWYDDSFEQQDLPIPVKSVLITVHTYGYNHHIERLMVLGNWFLLNEYDPKSVYTWFSSMYVDAYEWVMVPNVQGMSQYADGGNIATKPYISGGNYLQKMGNWWPSLEEAKKSDFNTLYWAFLYNHRDKLKDNFRMGMVLKLAEKLNG
jgi:deoxyribodipyrimidine photolyase-related protein